MSNYEDINRVLEVMRDDMDNCNLTSYTDEIRSLIENIKREINERNIYTDVAELQTQVADILSRLDSMAADITWNRNDITFINGEIREILEILILLNNWIFELEEKVNTTTGADDTGWLDLELNDGWTVTEYATEKPMYRKVGKLVMLRGLVNGTSSAATTIGTLPVGFRPSTARFNRYVCAVGTSNATANLQINYYGVISDYAKGSAARTYLALNGISFLVD